MHNLLRHTDTSIQTIQTNKHIFTFTGISNGKPRSCQEVEQILKSTERLHKAREERYTGISKVGV